MYGTVARLRVRPDTEEQITALSNEYAADALPPGFLGQYIYQLDADRREYFLVVVFQSKENYVANANSPAQDARYRRLRALLADDPEWHDGEIILGLTSKG